MLLKREDSFSITQHGLCLKRPTNLNLCSKKSTQKQSTKNMSKTTPLPAKFYLHLLAFIFFTSPFHGNCQAITSSEKATLLRLKEHWLDLPAFSSWTSSSDHCTWDGITCSDSSVTRIELVDKNITETVPPFMCDLKNLSYIDLSYNHILGPFPGALYNCFKLEYLDLSVNYFVGALPDDIFRLSPQLQYLSLEVNNFTGDIPASIGRLQGLKTLTLAQNLFNGTFPPELGNLMNLEELALNINPFVPQSIPSNFTGLKKMRNLWMTETNLIGEIPEDIGNMTNLEFLDLSKNGLVGRIPDGLFQLKNLTMLYLHENRFSGWIPQSVTASNLQVIDLTDNNLTGHIPGDFGNLTKLTGLGLSFNQLSGGLPESMGRLPALVDLKIFYNNLSGELPPDIGRHSKLRRFEVAANNFVGPLPEGLCTNGALLGLVVFDNNLSGELPKSLERCNSLLVFMVYGNRFSGRIPDGLWTLLNLTQFMVKDNLFTGALPEKVASNLSLIEISNNKFSGKIPAGVSSWHNLREFKASNNLFSGEIPLELTALPSLTELLLDGNQFSGNFPSNIISWQSLTSLNLSRNRLSGQIPAAIGLLPVLTYLDFSKNEFSGEIPPELGYLRLSSLNLSSNRLTGRIPGQFENAVYSSSFLNNPGLCATNPSSGLNACISTTRKSNKLSSQLVAALSSIAAVAFIVFLLYALFLFKSYRKRKHESDLAWELTPFQRLKFTKSTIISGLTENNTIGSGGSGKVHRVAINRSGESVAVKRIWNNKKLDEKLEKAFLAEVQVLGTIRHNNIVKLLCYLCSGNSKLLVYEYMANSSLDRWLHSKSRPSTLTGSVHRVVFDWPKRMQVAIGAAQGLSYMHHHCSPPIIHRDVKSSNILLDSDFNAKIADFGLARMLIKEGDPNTVSSVAGSFGYIAPEYAQTTRVNEKIDVYSFGVVLLELTTGREAHDGDEDSSLAGWAWHLIQEDKLIEDALDSDIKELQYLDEIRSVFKLGVMCTSTLPSSRPTMKEVLHILLQCSHQSPYKVKNDSRTASPLLKNSRRERILEDDDNNYTTSIV